MSDKLNKYVTDSYEYANKTHGRITNANMGEWLASYSGDLIEKVVKEAAEVATRNNLASGVTIAARIKAQFNVK